MSTRDHAISRRDMFVAGGAIAAALRVPSRTLAADVSHTPLLAKLSTTSNALTTMTTADGTKIFYKDWGSGKPVVFSHGWPLDADAWDSQMLFLGMNAIALSLTIAAATAGPIRPGTATIWTRMPTIWRRCSIRWTSKMQRSSDTRRAAAK